jgi:hypothetical protein
MEFIVQKGQSESDPINIIIQDDDDSTVFFYKELPVAEDNIDGWRSRLSYLQATNPEALDALLGAIPQLLERRISVGARQTYLNVLHAIFRLLEEETPTEADAPQHEAQLYRQLEQSLFRFQCRRQLKYYVTTFSLPKGEAHTIRISCDNFDRSPVEVSQARLADACQRNLQQICYLIENHIHFQTGLAQADSTTIKMFTCLSKALVNLIKQESSSLGTYISVIPSICTFIVKNELEHIEEQKVYLEPILNSRDGEEKKLKRLYDIIKDIEGDIHREQQQQATNHPDSDQGRRDGNRRLTQVIGLISDHYLKRYDLDHSADFWSKAKSKDLALLFFLTLHRRPYIPLFFQLLPLIVLFFFAYQHWNTSAPPPTIPPPPITLNLFDPQSLAILACYIPFLFLLIATLIQIARKRWLYSQLLLPRLLGAAIVGMIPLLLNDQSWQIGIQSSPVNWLLLASLTYTASFVYMFIEVYNTVKFVQGRSVADALKASGKIFLIAFSETLFIVTITSTLIFPEVVPSLSAAKFGIYATLYASVTGLPEIRLTFGFFPALIVLWTGIALFIGSFVQLLWQDKRITDSI